MNKSKITTLISTVQTEMNNIENNFTMRKFIPFDVYNDIVLHLISASIHLKDRNYDKAYYYAQMCSIKLKTMKTLIEVAQYKDKTEKLHLQSQLGTAKTKSTVKEKDCTVADVPLNPIMKANLDRKGTAFRVDLLDKNLFTPRSFKLSHNGKRKLNTIADAILSFPDSKVKIVGHTRWEDYRKHSKWKAKVVYNFLTSKGIDADKTTFLGVGNRVVMNTPWGLRRVSRVEIIIYNIILDSQVPIKKKVIEKKEKVQFKKKIKKGKEDIYKKLEKGGILKKVGMLKQIPILKKKYLST